MRSASDGGGDVPSQFVPGERRKVRETPPPKESRSIDDLAKDIKREYHESQIKGPNDEKSVRQQGEGQLSPKAPAESICEAIAYKFRERKSGLEYIRESKQQINGPKVIHEKEAKNSSPKDGSRYGHIYEVRTANPEIRGVKIATEEHLR